MIDVPSSDPTSVRFDDALNVTFPIKVSVFPAGTSTGSDTTITASRTTHPVGSHVQFPFVPAGQKSIVKEEVVDTVVEVAVVDDVVGPTVLVDELLEVVLVVVAVLVALVVELVAAVLVDVGEVVVDVGATVVVAVVELVAALILVFVGPMVVLGNVLVSVVVPGAADTEMVQVSIGIAARGNFRVDLRFVGMQLMQVTSNVNEPASDGVPTQLQSGSFGRIPGGTVPETY
jgi:hypothetical protein